MKSTATQHLEITKAEYTSGYKIRLTFNDGKVHVMDLYRGEI